ncbi:V-type ATPase subunit [Anaerocolumna cellulosilytica]|nr:V-type ATPase subunit [Anaerocolumna cellulosilytica]MBB5194010.1 V/A-type H+-transporting ATPase subunit C [Anaerocolumna cellulosilytica]
MADNQFIYAVARIRTKELSLLDNLFFDQLLACKSYQDCLRLLAEKGWGRTGEETAEEFLTAEREKTWEIMRELVEDMSVFDTFLLGNDYHNLKAAIKTVYLNQEVPGIFVTRGTIDTELIVKAAREHDFALLPEEMREIAQEAYQVLFHTGDSQLCDIIIDKASLEAIYRSGKASGNDLLLTYSELKVAAADINIAIRGAKTGKKKDFFLRALAQCSTLDVERLSEAALKGPEAIYEYLDNTSYYEAVQAIKESPSSFEKWCDDKLIQQIKPQKYNSFSLSPLAAYVLAKENEIKSVRIVLSGKLNNLSEGSVRERLREMYV